MMPEEPGLSHSFEDFDEMFSGGLGRVEPVPICFSRDELTNAVMQRVAGAVRELLRFAVPWRGVGSVDRTQLELFLARMELVALLHPDDKTVMTYSTLWGADACIAADEWITGWAWLQRHGSIGLREVVNRLPRAGVQLTGSDLLAVLRSSNRLTDFGRRYPDEIADAVEATVQDYYDQHGTDPISRVHGMFDYDHIGPEDLDVIERLYEDAAAFELLARCHAEGEERQKRNGDRHSSMYERRERLFSGFPLKTDMAGGPHLQMAWIRPWTDIPTLVQGAMHSEARRVVRAAENLLREEKGLPNVGEGWIQESELFHRVSVEWPRLRVVQHGRPSWLGRQHLDIWLPDANVAVEYQGAQHSSAIAYFGGEEGFREAQRRDRRKAELCHENGCRLLYAEQGYQWGLLRQEIQLAIEEERPSGTSEYVAHADWRRGVWTPDQGHDNPGAVMARGARFSLGLRHRRVRLRRAPSGLRW